MFFSVPMGALSAALPLRSPHPWVPRATVDVDRVRLWVNSFLIVYMKINTKGICALVLLHPLLWGITISCHFSTLMSDGRMNETLWCPGLCFL